MPGTFSVPASSAVGISAGWRSSKLWTPLPPTTRGAARKPGRTYSPPVPCGPSSPLWPVKQSTSMPSFCTGIGQAPAVCAASTINSRPCFFAKWATNARSVALPVTLDAPVTTTALVLGRSSSSNCS